MPHSRGGGLPIPKSSVRTPAAPRTIEGLGAAGPHPDHADKLALFGQFVGDWEIDPWRNLEADGSWSSGKGELHWGWILEGRGVQDVWSTIDPESGRSVPIGTTVRFYDPRTDDWQSVWISPRNHTVQVFRARAVGAEIVLESRNAKGVAVRWIFSEITPDAFRWRGEENRTPPDGWLLCEEMRIRRHAPR